MSDFRRGGEPYRREPGRPMPGGMQAQPPLRVPSEQQIKAIIEQGDAELLVKSAHEVGKDLKDRGLTTTQIRGIFGTVRQIQMKWPHGANDDTAKAARRQLLLLKPKLAYQASRDRGSGVNHLQQVLAPAIDLVADREQFTHFVDYFEAILAYHKAEGGRDL